MKWHPSDHFCHTLITYTQEMAACSNSEVSSWSVDDKNKLLVGGGPCVDRCTAFKQYFMKNDAVHYPNHNFATGCKIIQIGICILQIASRHLLCCS